MYVCVGVRGCGMCVGGLGAVGCMCVGGVRAVGCV